MGKQYLRIGLSRSRLPFSYGVRLYDTISNFKKIKEWKFTPFSHGCVIDGDSIIESTFTHGGVKEDTLDNFKKRASYWYIIDIEVVDKEKALAAIRREKGKPYDDTAIYGFLVKDRNYQEPDKWFCIELLAMGLYEGGSRYFEPEDYSIITPDMLFKLPHVYVDSMDGKRI